MSAIPATVLPSAAAGFASSTGALALPAELAHSVWRADELGHRAAEVRSTGWPELDAELPGGGWPTRSLVEVLARQPSVLEWRLLGPALREIVRQGRQIVVVGSPWHPHLPGLRQLGIDERRFVWIRAELPAERLWTTEQLIKSGAAGAVVAWLPQARPDQLRRLQVCAQDCDGLVFLCRPQTAQRESSAAPLRVSATVGLDWTLNVQILKRRGPLHDTPLSLPSIPDALADVLTPHKRQPSRLIPFREAANAVGSPVANPVSTPVFRQHVAAR